MFANQTTKSTIRLLFNNLSIYKKNTKTKSDVTTFAIHRIAVSWLMFGSVICIRLLSKVISQSITTSDHSIHNIQQYALTDEQLNEKNPGYWQKYPETQTTPKKPRSSGKNPAVATLAALACAQVRASSELGYRPIRCRDSVSSQKRWRVGCLPTDTLPLLL